MASLIGWLANAGARKSDGTPVASGYAWFYQPGSTSTQVTVFSDADGLYAKTQPVRLDAGGRAEVWTSSPVELVIQDSTGATVRTQDRANTTAAAQVELQNAVATGTSLATGAQVAGGRTDLHTYLTNVAASNGARDGSVLVGAVTMLLKDALKPLARIYDITAQPYGATGDGITDDTIAVQAAITAADTAGGIVLVPPGTYNVRTLSIPSNMAFIGAGSGRSILSTTYALDTLLVASGQFCAQGMKFKTTAYGLLRFTGAVGNGTAFFACRFELTNAATKTLEVGSTFSNLASFTGCEFVQTGAGGALAFLNGGCSVHGGAIVFVSGRAFGGEFVNLQGTYIEYQGAVAGNLRTAAGSSVQSLTGCYINASGIGTLALNPATDLVENGNFYAVTSRDAVSRWNEARESASVQTSGSAISITPTPLSARRFMMVTTGASFVVNNATGAASFDGYDIQVFYKNTSGGPITPTFGTMYKGTLVSVASGSAICWHFTWSATLGLYVQVGSAVAYAS